MVAESVSRELELARLTADFLSETTGIPRADLAAKLASRRDFTITEVAAIAEALGIPVARLLPRPPEQRVLP